MLLTGLASSAVAELNMRIQAPELDELLGSKVLSWQRTKTWLQLQLERGLGCVPLG